MSTERWTRRRFVQGLVAGGVVGGLGRWDALAWTKPARQELAELRGTSLDLTIGETPMNITGAPRIAQTINGSLPGPTLRWREGDTVTLRVAQHSRRGRLDSLARHHPAGQHGRRAGLSFDGIHAGETYTIASVVRQSGTYWYHSHSGFQEQRGVYGPLVIEPREPEPFEYDREHVVLLTDWTDEDPARVFAKLKKRVGLLQLPAAHARRFLPGRAGATAWSATLAERRAWGEMRMSAGDLADVTGSTYTYLMNGAGAGGQLDGPVHAGRTGPPALHQRLRDDVLRRAHPGLKMTVVAADGLPVRPVERRRVPHRGRGDLRRDRRAAGAGGVHDLRAGHGPHGLRGRHACRARGAACAGAGARRAARADDGRHGPRRPRR